MHAARVARARLLLYVERFIRSHRGVEMRFVSCLALSVALVACGSPVTSLPFDAGSDASAPSLASFSPPLQGGMLLARADGHVVAVSADADRVVVFSLSPLRATQSVTMPAGSEPFRLAEDGQGGVHVVLRRAGAIASISNTFDRVTVRPVCARPRGIAWRSTDDALVVACAEGELVVLPASGGEVNARFALGADDLRDVVIAADRVLVSRFRSAEVLAVDARGEIVARWTPAPLAEIDPLAVDGSAPIQQLVPRVATRMIPAEGGAWLLHQLHRVTSIPAGPLGGNVSYVGSLAAIVETAVSFVDASAPSGTLTPSSDPGVALASDITRDVAGTLVVTSAGSRGSSRLTRVASSPDGRTWAAYADGSDEAISSITSVGDAWVVLRRDPEAVRVLNTRGPTPATWILGEEDSRSGRSLFDLVTPSRLACASCHPEGGDDGHVWSFDGTGAVRTLGLRSGLLSTAPFHWSGRHPDFAAVLHESFEARMGGERHRTDFQILARWVDALPVSPALALDAASVARGAQLFQRQGCDTCHAGTQGTNNETLDVGTGGAFQVPRLVGLSERAPYMRSGCAPTLRDRFTGDPSCTGGDRHGSTSALSTTEIDDLVAYLSSR